MQTGSVAANRRRFLFARALQIVGIILHHGIAQRIPPRIFRGFGLSAVGSGIIARSQRRSRVQRKPRRAAHGVDHISVGGIVALEHLIGCIVGHIIIAGAAHALLPQGVITRRDRLRLQRFQRIGIGHFIRHHAAEVIFDIDAQNGVDRASGCVKGQIAAEQIG